MNIFKGQFNRSSTRAPGPDRLTLVVPAFFILAHLLLMIAAFMVLNLALNVFQIDMSDMTFTQIGGILYSLLQIWIYAVYLIAWHKHDPKAVRLEKPSPLVSLSIIPLVLGSLGFAILWFELLYRLSDSIPTISRMLEAYEIMSQAFTHPEAVWLSILSGSILIPIAEELLFRGIVFAEFRRAFKPIVAILLNAAIFAIYHWNLPQSGYVFIAGIVFASAYYWSESLWFPMILHMLYNFFGSDFSQMFLQQEDAAVRFATLQIYMIPLSVFFLIALRRQYHVRHRRATTS